MKTVIIGYNLQDVINSIKDFMDKSSQDDEVRQLAVEIISDNPIHDIHTWVRSNLKYVPDPVRNGQGIEQFTSPIRLVREYREGKVIGEDCDSHAMLVAALYQSVGLPSHVALADYSGGGYEHAYAIVWSDPLSMWLDVDTTTKYPLGWLQPYHKILII